VNAKAGSSINAGEVAVTVADFSQWLVKTTDLTEIDVVKLTEGQSVNVTLDAIPDVELKGEILSIGQSYAENQGDVVGETDEEVRDVGVFDAQVLIGDGEVQTVVAGVAFHEAMQSSLF
jgi:hypothetical protein